ncbi:MAG: hypothetical protein ACPL5F_07185 [Moorellaceae bacterium]
MRYKTLTERILLCIDRELYGLLKAEAKERGISLAETTRRILRQYFDKKREDAEYEERYRMILEEADKELDQSVLEFLAEVEKMKRGNSDGEEH